MLSSPYLAEHLANDSLGPWLALLNEANVKDTALPTSTILSCDYIALPHWHQTKVGSSLALPDLRVGSTSSPSSLLPSVKWT